MPVCVLVLLSILVAVAAFSLQYVLYDGVVLLQTLPIQACEVMPDVFLRDHHGNFDVQFLLKLFMFSHWGGVVGLGMWNMTESCPFHDLVHGILLELGQWPCILLSSVITDILSIVG